MLMLQHVNSNHGNRPEQGQLSPLNLKNLLQAQSQPVPWLVENRLTLGRAVLLTGMGGSSKSTLLAQLGISVATGITTLACMPVAQTGSVVLALAENTPDDAHQWLGEIVAELGLSEQDVDKLEQKMHVFALAGQDTTLLSTAQGKLQPTDRFEELLNYCRQVPDLKLIGLDPAIAFTQGREVDEGHQRLLANLVEHLAITTGACVILVSHAAKGSQYQGEPGSHISRGSGALTDALRLEMAMKVMSSGKEAKRFQISEEETKSYVRLQITKANRLPPEALQAVWFKRGRGGVLKPVTLNPGVAVKKLSDRQQRFQQAARLLNSFDAEKASVPFRVWQERFAEAGLLTGSTEHAQEVSARRLMAALAEGGWVHQIVPGMWEPKASSSEANPAASSLEGRR
jgi:RecA-family ATPase